MNYQLNDFAFDLRASVAPANHIWVCSGFGTVAPLEGMVAGVSGLFSPPFAAQDMNRARFLNRGEVGRQYPVTIRVSATDYCTGGLTPEELVRMLKTLESELDAIHVSTGGLLPIQPSDVHTGYQVPHAAAIKQHLNIPVIAVGKIYARSLANRILEDQLADCIAIGSPLLADPDYAEYLLMNQEQASTTDNDS